MIFLWLVIILVIADLRAWFYNSSQIVRRTDQMVEAVKSELEGIQGFAPVIVQSSALDILTKLPDRYKHIRDYDHYKSTAWTTRYLKSQSSFSKGSWGRGSNSASARSIKSGVDMAAIRHGASFYISDYVTATTPRHNENSSATVLAHQQSLMLHQQGGGVDTAWSSPPISSTTSILVMTQQGDPSSAVAPLMRLDTPDDDSAMPMPMPIDVACTQKSSSRLLVPAFTSRPSKRIIAEG
jgi:hypothetical protein